MKRTRIIAVVLVVIISLAVIFAGCDFGQKNPPVEEEKEYTIQYTDSNGIHQIKVKSGELYSLESIPQKTGYKFLGLYDAETGGTQYVNASGSALAPFTDNKNVVLFPQFAANEYTLVLDYQGASITGERQLPVNYGSKLLTLPTNVSLENKEFLGWFTKPGCQGIQVADKNGVIPGNETVTEDIFDLSDPKGLIYLYAGFEMQKFDVTFYFGQGIEPEVVKVEYGTPISQVVTETRVDGMGVYKWSTKENDTELSHVFTGKIVSDTVLYAAKFAPVIDFETKGGDPLVSIVEEEGKVILLPMPTRKNYKFMHWINEKGETVNYSTMPGKSVKLYAVWQAMIVFDENGGLPVNDIAADYGTAIELPSIEREGYIFAGWYDKNNEVAEIVSMPAQSVELTARWYKIANKSFVILNESKYVKTSSAKDTFVDALTINMSEFLPDNFVGKVNIDVVWKEKNTDATQDFEKKVAVGFYTQREVSEIYRLARIITKHTSKNYETVECNINKEIQGNKIYVTIASDSNGTGWLYNGYITDFRVDIEYPDVSKLY